MCGILGLWGQPTPHESMAPLLERMVATLRHRGPDSSGLWTLPQAGLGFGHTRLSILDLSPAGHQPMLGEDGALAITYNGEVYNYQDVRAELEAAGLAPAHGWRGHSDTEAILAAVRAWGMEPALSRFIGMFAFALWDATARTLTLVRDRLGIKPLYYGYVGGTLAFGSELAPLRVLPGWRGGIDPTALGLYLRHLYVPAPHCIHPGILKLAPGTLVRITEAHVRARTLPEPEVWWSLEDQVAHGLAHPFAGSETEAVDALESLLADAVRLRMVADVPLGAFLSGGIDSSTVTALMQAASSRPVQTFSIGSTDPGYNEAAHAAQVAAHLGTDHTELYVEDAEARAVIPDLPQCYDEPFADASQIPTCLVSRLARQKVTVSLSGDGGDELFGGYNRHLVAPALWTRLSRLPATARAALGVIMRHGGERAVLAAYALAEPLLPKARRHAIFRDKLQKVTDALAAPDRAAFYHALVSFWKDTARLVPTAGPGAARRAPSPAAWDGLDFAPWMMAMDTITYLPGDILTKVDRASMAVALEARVPILDHRVAAFAWSLPQHLKIRDGVGKYILRQVLYRHVPKALVERPKQGFGIPLHTWLRGPLRPWAEALLSPEALGRTGYIKPGPIRSAWADHLAGRRNYQYHLWAVLMFQGWAERHA
ncbi:MAG: asparagine synthase (glutamine-hydrolyzing) [Desulfovibrionaceae bacterium]